MEKFNKVGIAISKISEIVYWMSTALSTLLFIATIAAKDFFIDFLSSADLRSLEEFAVAGFKIEITNAQGAVDMGAVTLIAFASIITSVLLALIFRNVYLILKSADTKKESAEPGTWFTDDITAKVRQIGYLFIAIPIAGLVMSVIAFVILGSSGAEVSVSFDWIIMGIIILCLSQAFAYGAELQKDVDGLV